ncbi:cation transporter [Candidatus Woesearchaeota archaeon]|nr:cation transporter [Candidatus Woesearchaeota archaeon]
MGKKSDAAFISIAINVALISGKIFVYVFTGSISIMAEAVDSFFDLVASVLAYFGVRKAEQPDDEDHPYGHEKFETLSSFVQALLIIVTAFFIFWKAYDRIRNPVQISNTKVGIVFIVVSMFVAFFTSRYLLRVAREEGGSHALEADSAHFSTDVLGSLSVLAGFLMAELGFAFGDPLAAFAVGLIMLYLAWGLLKRSFFVFMDFSPESGKVGKIRQVLDRAVGENKIVRYHKLRARMGGSRIFLEFHIHVPKRMSIVRAHSISAEIKKELKERVPELKYVTIHIEPE